MNERLTVKTHGYVKALADESRLCVWTKVKLEGRLDGVGEQALCRRQSTFGGFRVVH